MNCQHRWLLGSPQHLTGDTEGTCKLCGAVRTFRPERNAQQVLAKRTDHARMANRKGQSRRHPQRTVAR